MKKGRVSLYYYEIVLTLLSPRDHILRTNPDSESSSPSSRAHVWEVGKGSTLGGLYSKRKHPQKHVVRSSHFFFLWCLTELNFCKTEKMGRILTESLFPSFPFRDKIFKRQLHLLYFSCILFFFLIWLHWVLVVACGIQFPDQRYNLDPCIGNK